MPPKHHTIFFLLLQLLLSFGVQSSTTFEPIPVYTVSLKDISEYRDEIKRHEGILSFVKESVQLDGIGSYQGITFDEMQKIIIPLTSDALLQSVFKQVPLIGSGGSLFKPDGYKGAFVAAMKASDGKYNVIYCIATQTKQINWVKIGGAAAIAGTVLAVLPAAMPVAVGKTLAAAGAIGNAQAVGAAAAVGTIIGGGQYFMQDMPQVTLGFIAEYLSNRNLLVLPKQKNEL